MSKLADLRNAGLVGDPFFGALIRGVGKLGRGIGRIIKGVRRPTAIVPSVQTPGIVGRVGGVLGRIPRGAIVAGGAAAAGAGLAGVLGRDAGMGMRRRRGRGITSRELRGFRKVTNLLRKVGMVPKGLRRGKKVC